MSVTNTNAATATCASRPRAFLDCAVTANRNVADGIFELVVQWNGTTPLPGQFFLIRPKRASVLLGRPISVFAFENGTASLLTARRGTGTKELENLRVGEIVEMTGPLGNVWPAPGIGDKADPLAMVVAQALSPSKPLALVGGGIGLAPLAFLARTLKPASYDLFAGFRSSSYGIDGLQPRTLVLATEDGCEGCRGRVPDYLDPCAYGAVFACGPDLMLRAVVSACAKAGTPCVISMEKRMACGVGACLGCTIATKSGNRRCCVDGPIFDAEEVLFDE
ncbi:MAG: dihydroorotate dehydrogenase electron transfer subunit [Treponemataceae bacterium]